MWISQTDEIVELRDLVVQFRMDLVSSMAQFAPELENVLPLLERARHGIEFRSFETKSAEVAFRGIRDSSGAQRIGLLLELLYRLAEEQGYVLLSTLAIRSSANQASLDKIQQVTQYISENFSSEITLSDMASLVAMNNCAFSRFFAKATGNSFICFVSRVRISKACELLSDSKMPITNICCETWFNNVANFNRRFRELKDCTPREYRQQFRLRHGARSLGD